MQTALPDVPRQWGNADKLKEKEYGRRMELLKEAPPKGGIRKRFHAFFWSALTGFYIQAIIK